VVVRDEFDLSFYIAESRLILEVKSTKGRLRKVRIPHSKDRPLGLEVQPYKHKNCQNNCIFCFIDQMPRGLRRSLYQKDDDYLFSYVYGNYITLTNLSEAETQRIITQRIHPLYISLHTTDAVLRQQMMRSRHPVEPLQVLSRFSDHGISFHIQIVLVPGFNDGEALRRTITDLMRPGLRVLSIGIVPVGLTRFREGLYPLQAFEAKGARQVLQDIDIWRREFDSEIIYAADEFYVLAAQRVPPYSYYNDYPQIENGIGMLRFTHDEYFEMRSRWRGTLRKAAGQYLLVTSRSAAGLMQRIVKDLNKAPQTAQVRLQVVRNDFLGEHISVAGLLTFSDLMAQVHPEPKEGLILPDSMFNEDGLTLDGVHYLKLKEHFPDRDILLVDQLFMSWEWV
jgi:putative radical SAM enzyme (TIGR03279 family)